MKRFLIAVLAPLALAGCAAVGTQGDEPSASDVINADAGCAEVVANEYEQAQRPPSMEVRSTVREGDAVLVTGIARGKTTNPVPYEFECRYMNGTTVLASFERAEDEEKDEPDVSNVHATYDSELASNWPIRASDTKVDACKKLLAAQYQPDDTVLMVIGFSSINETEHGRGHIIDGTVSSGLDSAVTEFACSVPDDGPPELMWFLPEGE